MHAHPSSATAPTARQNQVKAEAARRGVSKAALIRACIAREVGAKAPSPDDPWDAMIGWLDDDPVDDTDDVIYGPKASRRRGYRG
jgi:hypothetical protein